MTEANNVDGPETYVNRIVGLTKPNATYRAVAGDLGKVVAEGSLFTELKLDPTSKNKREEAFSRVAAAYLGSAYGIGYDDPTVAGGQLKSLIQRLPDSSEILSRIYGAIERGEKPAVLHEINQVWKNVVGGNKLEALLADLRNQPDEVKMPVYDAIAQLLGNVDGYQGSAVSVAENLPGAVSGLQQRLALAESVSKTPAEKGANGDHRHMDKAA